MSATYLVVDDSRLHHQMYDLIFARPALAGSRVLHAYDGQDGYAQFAAHPDLAMVFLDLNMPVMTGLEFLELRRRDARHLHIPVVLVTTESTADDESRGMAAGAWAYLRKPFHPAQLESLVARASQASEPVRTA
jgi:two-component system chemotaxis response regulator CheY